MAEETTAAGTTYWHGPVVVEGVWSGDGRQFAEGSLSWADLPLPLKYQPAESPGHEGSVIVGRIDHLARVGNQIMGSGVMDDEGVNGREAIRLMHARMLRGVSIMADDTADQDVELVFPDADTSDAGDSAVPATPMDEAPGEEGPGGEVEIELEMPQLVSPKMIVHHGRIRSATMVAEPAFAECVLTVSDQPPAVDAAPPVGPGVEGPMVAAAVGPHQTATVSGAWDGPGNERRLPSPMPEATGRAFYAWIDDSMVTGGEMPKAAGRFGHHDVSDGGVPGAANIRACQTGIGVLNGGRGGTTIPDADVQGVYNHLAGHLRDAGLEPPELTAAAEAVTAAGYTINIPEVWPEEWFDEPREAPPFGALHITAAGRVFGYLAPSRVAHRAFRGSGRTVTVPRNVDYSEFQNKPCLVASADGQVYRINAGNVTFDCGHPSPTDPRRQDPAWAMQHYDNTCAIAARVRVGENDRGTWVAGGLLHGITPDAVERMMASALSGDWQGGKLNAALLVPVEGFPVAAAAKARLRDDVMVSSSVPVVFDPPDTPAEDGDVDDVFDLIASAVGRDDDTRWRQLLADAGRDETSRWHVLLADAGREVS